MNHAEPLLAEIFNQEIVRELLIELCPDITDEQVIEMWNLCEGNPWNASVLFQMKRIMEAK